MFKIAANIFNGHGVPRTARTAVIVSVCMLSGACYSPPFRPPELVPTGDAEPRAVADRYARALPDRFETENTIIFRFFRNEIAALGYARVDRTDRTFEIVCLNHMGAQLFHISGDADGKNHLKYAIPEFREHPEFTDAVGNDIRRVYFDLIPAASAEPELHRNRISFEQRENDINIEYVFGGEGQHLLQKRARTRWRVRWEVAFYEYFPVSDGRATYVFPRGIVLHNRRHRYRLIIKTRSVEL